jgi:hypothetical protein
MYLATTAAGTGTVNSSLTCGRVRGFERSAAGGGWLAAADQAGLLGDEADVIAIPDAADRGEGKGSLVDLLRQFCRSAFWLL